MKPEVSSTQFSPEQTPVQYEQTGERVPVLPSPETGIETGAERHEQAAEAQAATVDGDLPLVLPLPIATVPDDTMPADQITTGSPLVAADEDLIEKEWVDRAKKIIVETKDDPYRREAAVSQLQIDYLKKRYGREPGAAN